MYTRVGDSLQHLEWPCFTHNALLFPDNPISDAVITVPSYFTQAERQAVKEAAEMVGINVLQLLSDNVAGTLNIN